MPDRQAETRLERNELDLSIDHHLGRDFPRERRDALWEAHQRLRRRRLRTALRAIFGAVFTRASPADADPISRVVIRAYAAVLTRDELVQWFGSSAVEASL